MWFVSGHSVCWRFDSRDPGFESCVQQRKTTILPASRYHFPVVSASKLVQTNMLVYWCLSTIGVSTPRPTQLNSKIDTNTVVKRMRVPAGSLVKMATAADVNSGRKRTLLQSVEAYTWNVLSGKIHGGIRHIQCLSRLRGTFHRCTIAPVCWRFGSRDPGFESCIQQRMTTILLPSRYHFPVVSASKLIQTNMLVYWCLSTYRGVNSSPDTHTRINSSILNGS